MYEESLFKAISYFGSQAELASALGVSQQAVNNWLNRGKRIPYLQALKIALYTEGTIKIEGLSSEEKDLTYLLHNSAFLKGAPVVYLPIEKIIVGNMRCPIYGEAEDTKDTKNTNRYGISRPLLVNAHNQLIVCVCHLHRSQIFSSKKVKVCRLNVVEIIKNQSNLNTLLSDFPISERVQVGVFVEQELGNRQGKRTDLTLPHTDAEVPMNGEKRKIAAKISLFKSHFSYSQAKEVLKSGLPEVIKAMDDGWLTISKAREIVNLSREEQRVLMEKMKKP